MSRQTKSSWVVRSITTLLFAMSLVFTSVVAATAADSAPPIQIERCGRIQDQVLIPNPSDGTSYKINGEYAAPGLHDAVTSTVTIVEYGWTVQTYTFSYTDTPCASEAANNIGSVLIGTCEPVMGYTAVTLPFTNGDDSTDYTKRGVVATFTRSDFSFNWPVGDVADGQTVDIRPGYDPVKSPNGGLLPGSWQVAVKSEGVTLASINIDIDACGDEIPPEEDPSLVKKPSGSLSQIAGTTKMRAVMSNAGVLSTTQFKLTIDRPGPGKVVKTIRVKAGAIKQRIYRAPVRTVFVLKASVKTVKANGQVVDRMTLLKRTSLRPSGH